MRKLKLYAALSWYYRKSYEEFFGGPSEKDTLMKNPDLLDDVIEELKITTLDGEWKDDWGKVKENLTSEVQVEFEDELFYTIMIIRMKGVEVLVIPVKYLGMDNVLDDYI